MKVVASSCGCCGIKHIRDFPIEPSSEIYTNPAPGHDEDQSSTEPEPYQEWNIEDCSVKVNAGDYFRGLVKQIKERRPSGMIAVNLPADLEDAYCCEDCDGDYDAWRQTHSEDAFDMTWVNNWMDVLTSEGFTYETFINSNSGAKIYHFTLKYGE